MVGLACRRWWTGWPRECLLKSTVFGFMFIYAMCCVLLVYVCVLFPRFFPDTAPLFFLFLLPDLQGVIQIVDGTGA